MVLDMHGFSGVVVAVVTPYKGGGGIDFEAFKWLLEGLASAGVDGVWVAGTTGEWTSLSHDERIKLFQAAVEAVGGRVTVFGGVSSLRVEDSIMLAREASDAGVDYIFSTPPLYYKPGRQALARYYLKLADSSDRPVFIYTIPSHVGYNIPVGLVEELALESNGIAGIKATVNDYTYIGELVLRVKRARSDFTILSGSEELMLHTLSIGGDGSVSAVANILPGLPVALRNAWSSKDLDEASRVNKLIVEARNLVEGIDAPLPLAVKSLINKLGGRITPISRPPISGVADVAREAIEVCRRFHEYLHPGIPCRGEEGYRIQYI